MTPLVSVVIPCHNGAPWLAAAVDSAIAQTWPRTEIIIVDDGSTDGSLSIARRFEGPDIQVVSQVRSGASAARNHGLRLARGELFQFLDADDQLSPDKIAAQVKLLQAIDAGSVATCRWGRFTSDPAGAVFAATEAFRDFSPVDYLIAHTGSGLTMHPAAWLVPKSVAKAAGPWDESLSLNDDGEYFARVVLSAARILFSAKGASLYRSDLPESLSRQRSRVALESLFRSVALISGHLRTAADSQRVRQALADYWQRLRFELYPLAPDLSRLAAAEVRSLGASKLGPEMGGRLKWVSRVLGWRLALRLRERLR